jgi:anti-anti-sigma factor
MKAFVLETEGDTLILVPQEDVSSLAGHEVESELARVFEQLETLRFRNAIIDLKNVECFGSLMLSTMQALSKRLAAIGGTMALCNVSEVGREVLQVTRFDTLWPICGSRMEALEREGIRP